MPGETVRLDHEGVGAAVDLHLPGCCVANGDRLDPLIGGEPYGHGKSRLYVERYHLGCIVNNRLQMWIADAWLRENAGRRGRTCESCDNHPEQGDPQAHQRLPVWPGTRGPIGTTEVPAPGTARGTAAGPGPIGETPFTVPVGAAGATLSTAGPGAASAS